MFVAIVYPYYISFKRSFTDMMWLMMVIVDIIFNLDNAIQLFTAIENEQGVHSKFLTIFTIRIRTLSFILDFLAVLPIATVCRLTHITNNERILNVAQVNRILKLHKIIRFFYKLENSFRFNLSLVRGIKYVLSLILITYFMGSLYYMIACFWP